MRKFFYGLGVVSAILILAGGIGLFMVARSGAALDRASKDYTHDAVVAIGGHWDAGELWKRASPHLRKLASFDQMRDLMARADRALGPLTKFRGSDGQALMSMNNAHTSVSAQYVATANFERGNARFRVMLVKDGGGWLIEGFHVDWHTAAGPATVGKS